MKFMFLGTAAAERIPSLFCTCPTCAHARQYRGRNVRRCCSAIINDDLLIDLGPDLPDAALEWNVSIDQIRYALQTHPHNDHLEGLTAVSRSEGCRAEVTHQLEYFCGVSTPPMLAAKMQRPTDFFDNPENQAAFNMTIHPTQPWDLIEFGDYTVQTVPANHDGIADAMLYAIRDNRSGSTVFYGTDTGPVDPAIWQTLSGKHWRFDLFILDCTLSVGPRNSRHLNHDQFAETVSDAIAAGVVEGATRVVGTHFVHHSNPPHAELVHLAAQRGFEPAYDGLTIDL